MLNDMGRMINRRRVCGGKKGLLPSGYTQLEYLESTGTQYIDTGILPKAGVTSVKLLFSLTELATSAIGIFGSRTSATPNDGEAYNLFSGTTEGQNRIRNDWSHKATTAPFRNFSGYVLSDVLTANRLIDVELNSDSSSKINSGIFSQSGVKKYDCNYSMLLGSVNTKGTAFVSKPKAKWYYCKILDNDVPVRNFISAKRNSDNVVGMYDTVTGNFFTNAGTGDFIAGPEV